MQSAVAYKRKLETYVGRGGRFAFPPDWSLCWGGDVRSSGSSCSGRFECACAVGVRQLRRKQPAGGGSVPEATGAATDDAAAVMFARLAAHAAVAANVAFARPGLLSAIPTFSSSANARERHA